MGGRIEIKKLCCESGEVMYIKHMDNELVLYLAKRSNEISLAIIIKKIYIFSD